MTLGAAAAAGVRIVCAVNAAARSSPAGRARRPLRDRDLCARLARAAGVLAARGSHPLGRHSGERSRGAAPARAQVVAAGVGLSFLSFFSLVARTMVRLMI
jgi:hypothetical protein